MESCCYSVINSVEEEQLPQSTETPPSTTTETAESSVPPSTGEQITGTSTISNGEGEKEVDFDNEDEQIEMPPPKPVTTNLTSLSDVSEV